LLAVSTFLVAATGVDIVTSFTTALACMGNVGPGLGAVGPADNYAGVPPLRQVGPHPGHAPGAPGDLHGDHPAGAKVL